MHNARYKLNYPSPKGRVAAERSEAVGWGALGRTARSSRFRIPHPASLALGHPPLRGGITELVARVVPTRSLRGGTATTI